MAKILKREIKIPLIGGDVKTVVAEVHLGGALALWRDSGSWNITHVRTGARLFGIVDAKRVALDVLEILSAARLDWAFGEFGQTGMRLQDMPEKFWAAHRAAGERIYGKSGYEKRKAAT